ncbi:MscS Mechanosensitive ion channel [Pyrolobus fumarii 1A]|uniref:MscS Mechanosensitive ion channel n=1 Tax=Pyrolobus fumarii (strain DSM 11204 / 1A) TaxID=694429 RepID=G0EDB7_PYRF1|nr:mechanosensitive ion channel family protein [Pyrolobus fumarii]AEM39795.1 MscS Mechanosensitive ion channel [Pyrolobus fumarii 1A]
MQLHTDVLRVFIALIPFAIAALILHFMKSRLGRLVERNILSRTLLSRLHSLAALVAYCIAALIALYTLTGAHEALYAAIALGLASIAPAIPILTNIYAYYVIMTEHIVAPGEMIILENGVRGTVHSVSLFSTILRTGRGEYITIPNKLLLEHIVRKEPMDRSVVELEVKLHGIRGRDASDTTERLEAVSNTLRRTLSEYRAAIRGLEASVALEALEGDTAVYRVTVYMVAASAKMLAGLVSRIITSLADYNPDVRIRSLEWLACRR